MELSINKNVINKYNYNLCLVVAQSSNAFTMHIINNANSLNALTSPNFLFRIHVILVSIQRMQLEPWIITLSILMAAVIVVVATIQTINQNNGNCSGFTYRETLVYLQGDVLKNQLTLFDRYEFNLTKFYCSHALQIVTKLTIILLLDSILCYIFIILIFSILLIFYLQVMKLLEMMKKHLRIIPTEIFNAAVTLIIDILYFDVICFNLICIPHYLPEIVSPCKKIYIIIKDYCVIFCWTIRCNYNKARNQWFCCVLIYTITIKQIIIILINLEQQNTNIYKIIHSNVS